MPLPLFPGVPGGPELLVLLLILVLLFGVPLVLIAGGVIAWRRTEAGDGDRVEALESRVAELERELEAAGGDEPGGRRDGTDGSRDGEDERRDGRDSDDDSGAGGGPNGDGDGGGGSGGRDDAAGDPTDGHGS